MIRCLGGVLFALLVALPAAGQERTWEIEVFAGAVARTSASEGSRTLPPAGAPLVTSNPTFPSRETPSWLFGDGASLLNAVLGQFGSTAQVAPLDPAFAAATGGSTGVVGARLRRTLNPRWSAEISVDSTTSSAAASSAFTRAIDETRQSFASAFAALLDTGPFGAPVIDTSAISDRGRRRDMTATVALNARLATWGSLSPYATFGGGISAGSGNLPSANVRAAYHFSILGEVPISESNDVSLRVARSASFVIVLGGGLRKAVSDRWGLSVDARALLGPDRTRVFINATPSTVRGTPAGFVESFTNPGIQFSSDPATGRRSTLSGAPLQDFEVFSGGTSARFVLSVGVSRRF